MAYTRAKLSAPPDAVHLLFVECNTADLDYFAETITRATGVKFTTCLFDDLRQQAPAFLDQFDIIVTPLFHFEELKQIVGAARPIVGLLVEPSYDAVIVPLMHLPERTNVGLICATPESAETMRRALLGVGLTHLQTLTAGVDNPNDVTYLRPPRTCVSRDTARSTRSSPGRILSECGISSKNLIRWDCACCVGKSRP